MLKKLKIKNFTLIENLEVEFTNGFQVLTGETGAGKSVIVGAISLLCGQRIQNEIIRTGSEKSVLEAEFEIENNNNVISFLSNNKIDSFSKILLVRREFNRNGINRVFINDSPASLQLLSNLTSILIDLHGQHQHQKLLYVDYHGRYLDTFASLGNELEKYKKLYKSFNQIKGEITELYDKKMNSVNQHDLFSFQIAELDKARLDEKELDEMKLERVKLENSENLFDVASLVSEVLYESENSVLNSVSKTLNKLRDVENIDSQFYELSNNLNSAQVLIEEVGRTAEALKQKIEFDPEKLEEIRTREAEIEWLLKKYQKNNLKDLIEHHKHLKFELQRIQNFDDEIDKLEERIQDIQKELTNDALKITQVRKKYADLLEKKMVDALQSLGMNNANFKVNIKWIEQEDGIIKVDGKSYKSFELGPDKIEFLISLNKGEPLKPLQKVASGGEISRIMLAIKSTLNDMDDTTTMIFDEIDSGISGKIAQIVGTKFTQIGKNKQLIVITHLPQIASQAGHQYHVEKNELGNRTFVQINALSQEGRIKEIAKLLGGENISQEAMANAQKLLDSSMN